MKPIFHARSSVKDFGGKVSDYMAIHEFMDSSKSALADNRHRALTHNSWFVSTVMPRVFGNSIINSEGIEVAVREICERHVLEDFKGKYIPTASDYLEHMEYQDWMQNGNNGSVPSSVRKLFRSRKKKTMNYEEFTNV